MAAEGDGEEATVSLVDVLEEDEELEQEASAVLGGSDSEKCSYPEGYVKRQALYACNTCTPKGGEPAGICLACSYKCHEGHELFELYTKRNFRCDCGNEKFGEMVCRLFPEKEKNNCENKYTHNFFGLYCTCERPYPDSEDQVADEMIQCVVCEDWLHGRHLGCAVPECVELQEMICESCMNNCPFLWIYAAHLAVPHAVKACKEEEESVKRCKEEEESVKACKEEEEERVTRCKEEEESVEVEHDDEEEKNIDLKSSPSEKVVACEQVELKRRPGCKRKLQPLEAAGSCCRFQEMKSAQTSQVPQGAVFWPAAWRTKLCSCQRCKSVLAESGVSFLLDETDTVLAYENKGKTTEQAHGGEARDPLMSALDNLNRVQQLEIIHEYNDMKTELKDYLQRFAAEGKVVTPEDIRQFFEEQQSRKRLRANTGQYYCS